MSYEYIPKTSLEGVGIVLECMAILSLGIVLILRSNEALQTRSLTQKKIVALALAGILIEIPQMLKFFWAQGFEVCKTIGAVVTPLATACFLLFQISIFERFRGYTTLSKAWTIGLYCGTGLCFLAFATPSVLGNYSGQTTSNVLFDKWIMYYVYWYAWLTLVDVILNFTLLRIFWKSKLGSSDVQRRERTKRILVALCLSVTCYDIVGAVALMLSSKPVTDESVWRSNRGYSMISNSVIGFHGAFSLSYLNLLASLNSSNSKKVVKPPKSLTKGRTNDTNQPVKQRTDQAPTVLQSASLQATQKATSGD